MFRIACIGFCALTLLTSCIANSALSDLSIAEGNVSNLSRISLGMKECEVLKIMHTPYKQESYRVGHDNYHVWFYLTTVTALGQSRMSPMNLTPLTFRNCRLVATGYTYYHWLKDQKKFPAKATSSQRVEPEDDQLEKALQKALKPKDQSSPPTKSPSTKTLIQPTSSPPKSLPAQNQAAPSKQPAAKTQSKQPDSNKAQPSQSQKPNSSGGKAPQSDAPPSTAPKYNYGPISMSSPPQKPPPKKEEGKPDSSGKPEWNEEDAERIQEESEQNFDFW